MLSDYHFVLSVQHEATVEVNTSSRLYKLVVVNSTVQDKNFYLLHLSNILDDKIHDGTKIITSA